MTVQERNWMANLYNTLGQMADYDEMELTNTNQRATSSPNASLQDINPFEPPTIKLFKTTRETNRISQYDILPEEFNPLKSRLPNPITEPSGALLSLDGETT